MRIVYAITLLFICSVKVNAQLQQGQYDISSGIGWLSAMPLNISNTWGEQYDVPQSPNFFAIGKYYATNRFVLGVAIGVQKFNGVSYETVATDVFNEKDFILAIGFELVYIRSKEFQMYGFFGIGPDFYTRHSSEAVSYPSSYTTKNNTTGIRDVEQYTPLGFRFGNKIAAFVELGYGYKGIINAGLAFSIGRSEAHKKQKLRVAPDLYFCSVLPKQS